MKSHYLFPSTIYVSNTPALINTILGSCVAVCLWDPVTRCGGMNHYLLPLWDGEGLPSLKYGNVAIPKLIEKMLQYGVNKKNLVAKIFGGGAVLQLLNDKSNSLNIGEKNIDIAFTILKKEGIKILNYDVGGSTGRKIVMRTTDFKIFVKRIKKVDTDKICFLQNDLFFNFKNK